MSTSLDRQTLGQILALESIGLHRLSNWASAVTYWTPLDDFLNHELEAVGPPIETFAKDNLAQICLRGLTGLDCRANTELLSKKSAQAFFDGTLNAETGVAILWSAVLDRVYSVVRAGNEFTSVHRLFAQPMVAKAKVQRVQRLQGKNWLIMATAALRGIQAMTGWSNSDASTSSISDTLELPAAGASAIYGNLQDDAVTTGLLCHLEQTQNMHDTLEMYQNIIVAALGLRFMLMVTITTRVSYVYISQDV